MTPNLPDLHRHLDGSLRPETLHELAEGIGVVVPTDLPFFPGMGLDAALDRFRVTLAVLQTPDAVRRVAAEICQDAASDGVTTLEVRFAPHLHRGDAPETIVDAALDGLAGQAGLILCGLYGDPPERLDHLVQIGRSRHGVVGIDLAGGPTHDHRVGLLDYAGPFARARDAGLGRTVHAAEGRDADEIRLAILHLHAQRIGHGTTLLDRPDLLDLVLERGVTLEACPTSNWQVGVIPSVEAHPLAQWLAAGVRACVNTDNTLLSNVTAQQEHERARHIQGMNHDLWLRAIDFGHQAAFSR